MEQVLKSKFVKKLWGNERWIVNNSKYCAKILTIKKDMMCSIHYHKKKDETFLGLTGLVMLEIFPDKKNLKKFTTYPIEPGTIIRLSPKTIHRFVGLESPNSILEISTEHEEADSYRLVPAKRVDYDE